MECSVDTCNSCRWIDLRTFLGAGEKCENPLRQAHRRHHPKQLESAKMRMNPVLGENLEDLRVALHHQELEWPRSAPQSAATKKRYDRRHFHQLFRELRLTNSGSHGNIVRQDLGYFDNLLGIRHERAEEMHDVGQLFHRSKAHEIDNVLHSVPLDPLLRPRPGKNPVPHPCGVFVKQLEEHRNPGCFELPSPWRPSYFSPAATLSKLWWAAADRAIATLCCSCLHQERRRVYAAIAASCGPPVSTNWSHKKKRHKPV